MAMDIALASVGKNHIRFRALLDGTGTSATISTTGATPAGGNNDILFQLRAAGFNGILNELCAANTQGYGIIGPTLTAAEAKSLWLSDHSAGTGAPVTTNAGNLSQPTAIVKTTPQVLPAVTWTVDVGIDGSGNALFTVTSSAATATGACFIDIEVPGQIGL